MRGVFVCPSCNTSSSRGESCGKRACKTSLHAVVSAARYSSSALRELLWLYKYASATEAEDAIEYLLFNYLSSHHEFVANFAPQATIIPVPLQFTSKAWRGFNQTEMLASVYADVSDSEVRTDILGCRSRKRRQADIAITRDRKLNAKGKYYVKQGITVPDYVVLIDDVVTTGATMSECAVVLKAAGVKRVVGFSLLRG